MLQADDEATHMNFILKFSQISEQINQANEVLRQLCLQPSEGGGAANFSNLDTHSPLSEVNTLNSTINYNQSLFTEDLIYPQFNYLVDLSKLNEVLQDVNVQINSQSANNAHLVRKRDFKLLCSYFKILFNKY